MHCNFPPPYVSNKDLQEIPYLYFLASYFEVIRNFVRSVSQYIDEDEYKNIANILENYVPGIEEADMVDVISTFIHQVLIENCFHLYSPSCFGQETAKVGFRVKLHLPTCLPHTAEASHCPFNC